MKFNTKKYVIKGRIREMNYSSNENYLRFGSPYFLPLEEIIVYDNRNNYSDLVCENRISVIGLSRSGLYKFRKIKIRFLENLFLHEIKAPSQQTLDFIKRRNLLYFEDESPEYFQAVKMLEVIREKEKIQIEKEEIQDELFIKSQFFVRDLKTLLKQKKYEVISDKYVEFPILNHRWENDRKIKESIDVQTFKEKIEQIFNKETVNSVLETDLKTIYPGEKIMILGSLKIKISEGYNFKIEKVETLNPTDA